MIVLAVKRTFAQVVVLAAVLALMMFSLAPPASAQQAGLVNVNIENVANDIAVDLDVILQDVIDVGNVNVGIGVAANVCGVTVLSLVEQQNPTCKAETTNQALNRAVQRQLNIAG